jgi:hypothetical protein
MMHGLKICKAGPFVLPTIRPEYAQFSHLLANAISQIKELPDFSDDSKIAVVSDFGGEHKGASFHTYSFLLMAYNKIGPFEEKVRALRDKYDLLEPYSEFAFKDLTYGPRSRALPEFLHIVDNFIHGVLVTIAIDKCIGSVFRSSTKEAYTELESQLSAMELGQWKGITAEKLLRVCHAIGIFTALTTQDKQRLLWYCDLDAINEDGRNRRFEHTQSVFLRVLRMYCNHDFEILGFAKSFEGKSHLDDLLSIPDFAAGVVQDILQAHHTEVDDITGGHEKEALIRWIATEAKFLTKIVIQVVKLPNGELGSGLVHLSPVLHS